MVSLIWTGADVRQGAGGITPLAGRNLAELRVCIWEYAFVTSPMVPNRCPGCLAIGKSNPARIPALGYERGSDLLSGGG